MSLLRALLLAVLLGVGAPATAAQQSEAAFTQEMAERFRAGISGREIRISGPLQLGIAGSGDVESLVINLDRIWNFCRTASAPDCETSKANFVAAMSESLGDHPPIGRDQLRVMIRPGNYCTEALPVDSPAAAPVRRAGPAGLCALIAVDYPRTMRLLQQRDLEPLGLSAEQAWPLAVRQTLAALPGPQTLAALDQGSAAAVVDYAYIPSLLLNADGWRAVAARGDLLVAVPSEDLLIAVRAADVTDLPAFRAHVRRQYETGERGISPDVLRWTERGWEPLP